MKSLEFRLKLPKIISILFCSYNLLVSNSSFSTKQPYKIPRSLTCFCYISGQNSNPIAVLLRIEPSFFSNVLALKASTKGLFYGKTVFLLMELKDCIYLVKQEYYELQKS